MLLTGLVGVGTLLAQATSDTVSMCPDPVAVWQAARPLLGSTTVDGEPLVIVEDRGEEYAVTVKGRGSVAASTRLLRDPARDCAGRTRAAAVFVALVLRPEEAAAPTLAPAAPRPRWSGDVGAGAGALFPAAADGASAPSAAWWTSLRAELRRDRWGAEVVVGFAPHEAWRYDAQTVTARVIPVQLGVVHRLHAERWAATVHFDAVAMVVGGTLTSTGQTSSAFQLGAGPGLSATRRIGKAWSVFVRGETWWFPRPVGLVVDPLGNFGDFASLWPSLTLGMVATLP